MGDLLEQLLGVWSRFKIIDLSPMLEPGIPKWPTHPHLIIDPTVTHEKDGYYCQTISMAEHTGAHVDAPSHSLADRMDATIEKVELERLIGRAVRYDLSHLDLAPGDQVDADELLACEERMGVRAEAGDIALLHFGWMKKHWAVGGAGQFYALNSPGLTEAAVKLLYDRGIKAVGCDNIACDQAVKDGVSKYSAGHLKYWLPNDVLLIEELDNLDKLPDTCFFMALPLKIKNGSGSPVRPIALVEIKEE